MGPSHPATHGTVKFLIELDGETIVDLDIQVGYLHRGFEKECESGTWYQAIPYTDRLNYNSAILCNLGFCLAVEKLLGIETPGALPVAARAGGRALADRRPPDPLRRRLPRAPGDDALPLRDRGARAHLGPAGDALRRARHLATTSASAASSTTMPAGFPGALPRLPSRRSASSSRDFDKVVTQQPDLRRPPEGHRA